MYSGIAPSKKVIDALSHSSLNVLEQLGQSVSSAILFHLQRQLSVKQDRLFEDPTRFAESLENVFGLGAFLLEDKIIESMCAELRIKLEKGGGTFTSKIHEICLKDDTTRKFQLGALEESMGHH